MKTIRNIMLLLSALSFFGLTSCGVDDLRDLKVNCTIVGVANHDEMGYVTGGGRYVIGSQVELSAWANTGYYFIRWSDGHRSATRTITVGGDATYVALFSNQADDPNPDMPSVDPEPNPNPGEPSVGGFREDGASNALFSVSTSKQVRFSRGNLQFQASTATWRFAENQYDALGNANAAISATNSEWVDLFGWGTSGWNSGATAYEPWSVSTLFAHYYPGGAFTNSLAGPYAEADWAWHNAIANGGNQPHLWRTLTAAEWQYLLRGRANAYAKLGAATVGTVNGMVILPDHFTLPAGLAFQSGFYGRESYDYSRANAYTLDQWAQMEAAGAIFLPAAGERKGTVVRDFGVDGNYWSATNGDNDDARSISFDGEEVESIDDEDRYAGLAVRPVMD